MRLLPSIMLIDPVSPLSLFTLVDLLAFVFRDLGYLYVSLIILNSFIGHLLVQVSTANVIVVHKFDVLRGCVRI